jgi:glycosyltransferase involved in cell wall biosynthesis
MRVLLIHNFYGSENPSGENVAFLAERELLERRGIEVIRFETSSDEIRAKGASGLIAGGLSTPYNFKSAAQIRKLALKTKPDIVHVHNTFPLISPSAFWGIRDLPCAVVLTLHNYRLFCAAGMPLRDGQICTLCLDKRSVIPGIRYGCYRGSRLATIPLAISIALHRQIGTWNMHVDRFIALTQYQRELVIHAGLPSGLVCVKPQFYPGTPEPIPWIARDNRVLFVGRLSPEKGVRDLLSAWKVLGRDAPNLEIVGDGPDRRVLENQIQSEGLDRVRLLGQLGFEETQNKIAHSRLLVVPSTWFEGFPMVIREAYAFGVPVAASRLGSLAELVKEDTNGFLFPANSPDQIAAVVRNAWDDQEGLEKLARGARQSFLTSYTEDANFETLMTIYEEAKAERKNRKIQEVC